MSYGDVRRDEDYAEWTDNDDHERVLYGQHEYDPRQKNDSEGAAEPWPGRICHRCEHAMVDEEGFCNFCSATACKSTVEASLRWLQERRTA